MPICSLCNKREADKKGSHLIPHFLMKRIDNLENKTGRDYELGFELGTGRIKGYFGRNIQPDKLKEVYGELSEQDIANSRSSLIVDHLLCSPCEARLAKLEGDYSASLASKGEDNYQSFPDGLHATLFWISIFWRMSVSEHGFKLDQIDEYHLRVVLDGGLDAVDRLEYIKTFGIEITGIRYKLLRAADYTTLNPGFLYFQSDGKRPYSALIGEHAIFLDINNSVAETSAHEFFGLETSRDEATLNNAEAPESTLAVEVDSYKQATTGVVRFYMEDFVTDLDKKLNQLHKHFIGNSVMDPDLKQQIIKEITEDELPIGRKYTPETITAAVTRVLIMHEPYRSIAERIE